MNPAQFSNGGQPGKGIPTNLGQVQQNPQVNLQRQLWNILNNEGPYSGWQSTVKIEERVHRIRLVIDSLRLIQPIVAIPQAIQVALSFEQKVFSQSESKDGYITACNEKLARIRDTRQQQIASMSSQTGQAMSMQNAQAQSNAMQQMQMMQQMGQNLPFPPQLQHPMQASPIPVHQQNVPNLINAGQNMDQSTAFQQNDVAHTGIQQDASFTQTQQQRANLQGPNLKLTKQDNDAINKLAAQMAERTSPEDRAKIRANLENMTPEQRDMLRNKNVDPLAYFFRTQATKEWRRQKMAQLGANANNPTFSSNGVNQPQDSGQGPKAARLPLNQGNRAIGPNGQGSSASFMGNLDHFQGQQADGLRSQEAGQLVVPVSNPTRNFSHAHLGFQPEMFSNAQTASQPVAGRPMSSDFLAQQQSQQAQQNQQEKNQTAAQFQAHQAQARIQAQALAQQLAMSGQPGLQGTPQNPAMNMLTRPVDANVQGIPQGVPRPPSRAPMPGQQMPGQAQPGLEMQSGLQQVQNGQASQAQRALADQVAKFPPQLQAILRNKPQNQWLEIVAEYQRNPAMRQNHLQQAPGMQQALSQPGQVPRTQAGQFLGGSTIPATPMQHSLSAGPITSFSQQQNMTPQQVMQMQQRNQQLLTQQQQEQTMARQRQMHMQQQQQAARMSTQQSGVTQPPINQLDPRQQAFMDRQPMPGQIHLTLSKNPNFPTQIKLWGELKQWLLRNPIPALAEDKIQLFQKAQFQHFAAQNAQNAQNRMTNHNNVPSIPPTNRQPVPGQAHPVQMPQGQPGFPRQPQPGNLPSNHMGHIPPIPREMINKFLGSNPQLQNLPEPQLVNLIMAQRQKSLQRAAEGQTQTVQGPQQFQFMPVQPGQMPGQVPVTRQASNQGMNQNLMPPHPAQQRPQPASARPGQHPNQQQGMQPGGVKSLKRSNDDDVVEIPGPVAQSQVRTVSQPLGKQMPEMSREVLEKLKLAQQQQFLNTRSQMQQREISQRIATFSKEVQSTMPKLHPQKMDTASRAKIIRILTAQDTRNMLSRFEQFLHHYLKLTADDAAVKQLISQRLHIMNQFKRASIQNRSFEPAEQFSISVNYAETTMRDMLAKFQWTLERTQQPNASRPPGVPHPQPLTPENIAKLQAQEAQRKAKAKEQKENVAPPAPTEAQPPFSLGDAIGQGTPRYAEPAPKQVDLKLDPKRRKKNPASTPTAAQGAPGPTSSPPVSKAQKPAPLPFKCNFDTCEYRTKGFSTKADLDSHVSSTHGSADATIENPLAFFHEQVDGTFKPNDSPGTGANLTGLKALPMQKSLSRASVASNVKFDSKPSTPAGMARRPSQTSNSLITPKDGARPGSPRDASHASQAEKAQADPWANCTINPAKLAEDFEAFDIDSVVAFGSGSYAAMEDIVEFYNTTERWKRQQEPLIAISSDSSPSGNGSPAQQSDKLVPNSDASKSEETFVDLKDLDLGDLGDLDSAMSDGDELPHLTDMDMDMAGLEGGGEFEDDWAFLEMDESPKLPGKKADSWKDVDWDKAFEKVEPGTYILRPESMDDVPFLAD